MKRYLPLCIIAALLLCLCGCGKPRLDLNVASQPNVNPDNSGRPSPILVKIYELRNDLAFKQGDFQALFERPIPTLGADLIAADELVFIPGEARKVVYKVTADTKFVGVVAGFRRMERAQWRVIKPVDPEGDNLLALEFNDTSILVIPEKHADDWDPEEAVRDFQQQLTRPASQTAKAQGQAAPTQAAPAAQAQTAAPSASPAAPNPGGVPANAPAAPVNNAPANNLPMSQTSVSASSTAEAGSAAGVPGNTAGSAAAGAPATALGAGGQPNAPLRMMSQY